MGSSIWSSKGPTCEPSSTSLVVNAAATIRPVSASTPMCSLRHDRRRLVPCFSANHSPAPDSFNPVLPQSQAEHGAKRQRRRDRQGRIVGLTAPRGPWFCAPGRDRLFGEPHRQAATLAQGSIIFRPVRYPILLLRNVVTAIGIGLEWHGGHLRGVVDGGSTLPSGTAQPDLPPVEAWGKSNLDQRPAKSRSPNGEWSSTLPSPRRSAQLIRATRWRVASSGL